MHKLFASIFVYKALCGLGFFRRATNTVRPHVRP